MKYAIHTNDGHVETGFSSLEEALKEADFTTVEEAEKHGVYIVTEDEAEHALLLCFREDLNRDTKPIYFYTKQEAEECLKDIL